MNQGQKHEPPTDLVTGPGPVRLRQASEVPTRHTYPTGSISNDRGRSGLLRLLQRASTTRHVHRTEPLGSLLHFKFYFLALAQIFVRHFAVMDKHVFVPFVRLDESVSLSRTEPLNSSAAHNVGVVKAFNGMRRGPIRITGASVPTPLYCCTKPCGCDAGSPVSPAPYASTDLSARSMRRMGSGSSAVSCSISAMSSS